MFLNKITIWGRFLIIFGNFFTTLLNTVKKVRPFKHTHSQNTHKINIFQCPGITFSTLFLTFSVPPAGERFGLRFRSILASIWGSFLIHLASIWCLFEEVPFWTPVWLLFGRILSQNGDHFEVIFQQICDDLLMYFWGLFLNVFLSQFGVDFGTFLDTF